MLNSDGSGQSEEDDAPPGRGGGADGDSLARVLGPHLDRVLQRGTARHVAPGGHGVSVVAQAESEDFQEFSPSDTQPPSSCWQLVLHPRSPRRTVVFQSDTEDESSAVPRPRRRADHRDPGGPDGQRPVIRALWVQEVDWTKDIVPPPPQFTDSTPYGVGDTASSSEDSDRSQDPDLDLELMHVSSPHPDSQSESWDWEQSMLGDKVVQIPKVLVSAPLIQRILDGWRTETPSSGGLLFHHGLRPGGGSYHEDEHYSVVHHVQNGSYGDVFCVRDKRSGFHCAAKKVPLLAFRGEELSTWSILDSPAVVQLFGAVRDGPNVVLFMDLKPACLGQLLKQSGRLPEDLSLYYLEQTLRALEHLHHRRVLHLDVKADNVLLSADCRDSFLCDFGLAQTLDDSGRGSATFRGPGFPGTETHMAPEVVRGDRLGPEADVWSSCCMLLHLLNGHQPWTRFYSPPLCLQIVQEPPPLGEVPSSCNNLTAEVLRSGLQKDSRRRSSARNLRRRTSRALRAVGGLSLRSVQAACETLSRVRPRTQDVPVPPNRAPPGSPEPRMHWVSPWRTEAVDQDSDRDLETDELTGDWDSDRDNLTRDQDSEPKSLRDKDSTEDWTSRSESEEEDIYMGEEEWLKTGQDYEGDYEGDWEDEEDSDSETRDYVETLRGLFPVLQKPRQVPESLWGSEDELELLRDDVAPGPEIPTPSPEPRDDPPSCFSCSDSSRWDMDPGRSSSSSDDLSSGVFSSCDGPADGGLEWTASDTLPSSRRLDGIDIWIENVDGQCLRIRERRHVIVGHIAVGISEQVSGRTFTLETLDLKPVPAQQEIKESGSWLRCVPAPDRCPRWSWRVRHGQLELREPEGS